LHQPQRQTLLLVGDARSDKTTLYIRSILARRSLRVRVGLSSAA
jgi:hypothetical protein